MQVGNPVVLPNVLRKSATWQQQAELEWVPDKSVSAHEDDATAKFVPTEVLRRTLGHSCCTVPPLPPPATRFLHGTCIPWPPTCALVELRSLYAAFYQLASTHASTFGWVTLRALNPWTASFDILAVLQCIEIPDTVLR